MRPFHLRVIVFDPFLSDGEAASLGVEKVGIQEAFSRGNIVSNHLADRACHFRLDRWSPARVDAGKCHLYQYRTRQDRQS